MELFIMMLFGFNPEPLLFEKAQYRACEVRDNFSHDNMESTLLGTKYRSWGEDLARGYDNDYEIMQAFINSPTHLAILLGNYDDFGVGRCGDYMAVIVAK